MWTRALLICIWRSADNMEGRDTWYIHARSQAGRRPPDEDVHQVWRLERNGPQMRRCFFPVYSVRAQVHWFPSALRFSAHLPAVEPDAARRRQPRGEGRTTRGRGRRRRARSRSPSGVERHRLVSSGIRGVRPSKETALRRGRRMDLRRCTRPS